MTHLHTGTFIPRAEVGRESGVSLGDMQSPFRSVDMLEEGFERFLSNPKYHQGQSEASWLILFHSSGSVGWFIWHLNKYLH